MAKDSSRTGTSDNKRKRVIRQKPPPIDVQPGQRFEPHVSLIHEKLIGRIIIEFSRLDHMLSELIWHILKLEMKDGRLITTRMPPENKIAMLRTLVPRHFDGFGCRAVLSALDYADLIREDRNFIAHGLWGILTPYNGPMVASVRVKTDPTTIICEAFPAERMRAIIDGTKVTMKVLRRFAPERGPLPGK